MIRLRAHLWLLGAALPLLVRWVPLARLLRLLTPTGAPYRRLDAEAVAAAALRRADSMMWMRRRACLRQGLLLYHFLRLCGVDAKIRFSIYPSMGDDVRMHAHCWVTVGQVARTAPPADGGVEVLSYPA
jgi:hypothetical protein